MHLPFLSKKTYSILLFHMPTIQTIQVRKMVFFLLAAATHFIHQDHIQLSLFETLISHQSWIDVPPFYVFRCADAIPHDVWVATFFDYIVNLSLRALQGLKVSPKFSRTISRKVSENVFNMFHHPNGNKKGEMGRIGWRMPQIRVFWFRNSQISNPQFYFFSFKCGSGLIPINSHLGWGLTPT